MSTLGRWRVGVWFALGCALLAARPARTAEEPTYHVPVVVDVAAFFTFSLQAAGVGDVDGDGRRDVVLPSWSNQMAYLPGTGDAALVGAPVRLTIPGFVGAGGPDFRVVDVDGDGDLDLVGHSDVQDPRDIALNDGSAGFTKVDIPFDTAGIYAASTLLDLGRDGDLDLLTAVAVDSQSALIDLVVHEQVDGAFIQRGMIGLAGVIDAIVVEHLGVIDVNGDGRDDVVVIARTATGRLATLHVQDPDGVLVAHPTPFEAQLGPNARTFDADGDGDLDVGDDVFVLLNEGGTLQGQSTATGPINRYPRTFADMDGDLLDDLVALNLGTGALERYGNSRVAFAAAETVASGFGPGLTRGEFALGDLDDDGRLDVITIDWQNSRVSILRQSGMPAPRDVAVTPDVIAAAGDVTVGVAGRGLAAGAQLDLGPGIVTRALAVTADDAGTADLTVDPGIGGGMRRGLFMNPDGQLAEAHVEVRSVTPEVRRAKLSDTPAPARDVLRVRGSIPRNALSQHDGFTGKAQGLRLEFGAADEPFVLAIDADDPRWTERRRGRKLVFRTGPTEFPRIRLVVDTRRERFSLRVSFFDFPTAPGDGDGARLSYESGGDLGRSESTWKARRRRQRTLLRLR